MGGHFFFFFERGNNSKFTKLCSRPKRTELGCGSTPAEHYSAVVLNLFGKLPFLMYFENLITPKTVEKSVKKSVQKICFKNLSKNLTKKSFKKSYSKIVKKSVQIYEFAKTFSQNTLF